MGIPAQKHEPIAGPRAREFEQHKALHARPAPHPRTGFAHIDPRVSSRPRVEYKTPIHGGMSAQQRATAGVGGLGHAVQVQGGGQVVASPNALPHAYSNVYETGQLSPKHRGVPTYPGQRSRTDPNGIQGNRK
jgi:hypothetical protein